MKLSLPPHFRSENRIAVITDVHGEAELFQAALDAITEKERTRLIVMGDLIDRGPDSKGCLRIARELEASTDYAEVVLLPGNHEDLAYRAVCCDEGWAQNTWMSNGGALTFREFDFNENDVIKAMPVQMMRRLTGDLPLWEQDGSFVFVHAGIDPADHEKFYEDAPFHMDTGPLWIRDQFLDHTAGHKDVNGDPAIIVHGHTRIRKALPQDVLSTIQARLDTYGRIGIDTTGGAHLALLEIEGDQAEVRMIGPNGPIKESLPLDEPEI